MGGGGALLNQLAGGSVMEACCCEMVEGAVEAFVVRWRQIKNKPSRVGGECVDCVGGRATTRYMVVAATLVRLLVQMACTIFDCVPEVLWRSFVL